MVVGELGRGTAGGFRGRGLSNVMIGGTLDDVRAHGYTVTNFCPVLDHFIEAHPEYIPLIVERVPGTWPRGDHQDRSPGALRPTR